MAVVLGAQRSGCAAPATEVSENMMRCPRRPHEPVVRRQHVKKTTMFCFIKLLLIELPCINSFELKYHDCVARFQAASNLFLDVLN